MKRTHVSRPFKFQVSIPEHAAIVAGLNLLYLWKTGEITGADDEMLKTILDMGEFGELDQGEIDELIVRLNS